jgi:hypothetical protein
MSPFRCLQIPPPETAQDFAAAVIAQPTVYPRRELREVKVWDAIVLPAQEAINHVAPGLYVVLGQSWQATTRLPEAFVQSLVLMRYGGVCNLTGFSYVVVPLEVDGVPVVCQQIGCLLIAPPIIGPLKE